MQLLKTLAIPLITLCDSRCAHHAPALPLSQGTRLVICLVNVTVAMTIGLVIMNTHSSRACPWQGHVDRLPAVRARVQGRAWRPRKRRLKIWPRISPRILSPFSTNNIIGVVVLGAGVGYRFAPSACEGRQNRRG